MDTATETKTMTNRKVTLYFRGEFMGNIHQVEARAYSVEIKPYAQYSRALWVSWIPKGKRNVRTLVRYFKPDMLILDGWGHPAPDGLFPEVSTDAPVVGVMARHTACDDGWQEDFNAKIDPYIAARPGIVIEDRRQKPGDSDYVA